MQVQESTGPQIQPAIQPVSSPTAPIPVTLVRTPEKSMGIALLATLVFGPLGLIYVSVTSAIVWTLCSLILIPITFGLAIPFLWPVFLASAAMGTSKYNKKLRIQAAAQQRANAHMQSLALQQQAAQQ